MVNPAFTRNITYIFSGVQKLERVGFSEIDNENDTLVNVYLGDSTLLEKVSCSMDMSKSEEYKKLKPGQQISINGFCTGYLQDVELNRCVILPRKNK